LTVSGTDNYRDRMIDSTTSPCTSLDSRKLRLRWRLSARRCLFHHL